MRKFWFDCCLSFTTTKAKKTTKKRHGRPQKASTMDRMGRSGSYGSFFGMPEIKRLYDLKESDDTVGGMGRSGSSGLFFGMPGMGWCG